ncbi:MAG: serine hydrolase [Firmicutes bacterium]|nr:serine hydrolase [Bacillota bacterium]
MIMRAITDRLANVEGDIGISYIDLTTEKRLTFGNQKIFSSGALIMLMVLVECFKAMEEGRISKDTRYRLKHSDVGNQLTYSYGVLQYLHEDIELTVEDLYNLMVTVSDNVACNILIDMLGMDQINRTFRELGYEKMYIQRKIYDFDKIEEGIENYMSVDDVATIFERMYKGQLISEEASKQMLSLMAQHQKTRIIPDLFQDQIPISHLTSYDDNEVIDGGIIFAERPFILVMVATRIDNRKSESILRDITKICYIKTQGLQ